MKDKSLLLNIARTLSFLWKHLVEGKKILEKICSTVVVWYVVITSFNGLLTHWNQSKYVIRGFIINYFEHATETLIPSSRFK